MVSEEMFKECGRRRTDARACLYYKLTHEPKGSGELIMAVETFTPSTNHCFIKPKVGYWLEKKKKKKKTDS